MKYRIIFLSMIIVFILSCNTKSKKADDKAYFYIHEAHAYPDETFLDLRPIRFLTDDVAVEVARARGDAMLYIDEDGNEEYSVPNGYYIDDSDTSFQTYEMNDDALITSWAYSEEKGMYTFEYIGINNFLEFYEKRDGDYRNIPFIIQIKKGKVVSIYEQYVP